MNVRAIKALVPASALLSIAVLSSCMMRNSVDRYSDFTTNGFLSDECYQSVLEFHPDADSQGLVGQRESARKRVPNSSQIGSIVLDRLTDYRYDVAFKSASPEAIRAVADMQAQKLSLRDRVRSFLSYGRIAFTYYREDNSVVVIYRVERNALRERLNALEVFPEPERNETPIKGEKL
ncbi:MAG: hypothetical protein JXA20_18330 [Spirochaetes bacterium]|nr:hypothetical protein [Spirochaetota bacterium]